MRGTLSKNTRKSEQQKNKSENENEKKKKKLGGKEKELDCFAFISSSSSSCCSCFVMLLMRNPVNNWVRVFRLSKGRRRKEIRIFGSFENAAVDVCFFIFFLVLFLTASSSSL
jgi:hypothetical protein